MCEQKSYALLQAHLVEVLVCTRNGLMCTNVIDLNQHYHCVCVRFNCLSLYELCAFAIAAVRAVGALSGKPAHL